LVFSGIFFAAAHVYCSITPFQITHFDLQQVITAFGCGAVYAAAFLKTRSLLAPFLMHNFANTTVTVCGYLIARM
jgi:membrane protease YdiL (CAAX protease family)